MRLTNRTRYDSRQLKAFIVAGLKDCGIDNARIIAVPTYKKWSSGRAWERGQVVRIAVPREKTEYFYPSLALIVEHEAQHLLGISHKEMGRGAATYWAPDLVKEALPAWATGKVIEAKV